jgi:hypothetical protein
MVESADRAGVESCKSSLTRLWNKLHEAATRDQWDLANICIARCEEPLTRVAGPLNNNDNNSSSPRALHPPSELSGNNADELLNLDGPILGDLVPDLLPFSNPDMSFESSEFPWEALWYGLDGTGNHSSDGMNLDSFQT